MVEGEGLVLGPVPSGVMPKGGRWYMSRCRTSVPGHPMPRGAWQTHREGRGGDLLAPCPGVRPQDRGPCRSHRRPKPQPKGMEGGVGVCSLHRLGLMGEDHVGHHRRAQLHRTSRGGGRRDLRRGSPARQRQAPPAGQTVTCPPGSGGFLGRTFQVLPAVGKGSFRSWRRTGPGLTVVEPGTGLTESDLSPFLHCDFACLRPSFQVPGLGLWSDTLSSAKSWAKSRGPPSSLDRRATAVHCQGVAAPRSVESTTPARLTAS